VNINDLVSYHKSHGKAITMTSVQPEGRYGSLVVNEHEQITSFQEKPKGDGAWINGGFFVCEPEVFDEIDDDKTIWERKPLENLAAKGELVAYRHYGFWRPMDTLRDKTDLEEMWNSGDAKWKLW